MELGITFYPAIFYMHREGTDDHETTLFEFSIQPCKFRCVQSFLNSEKVNIYFVWVPQWLENCNHSYRYDRLYCKSLALKLSRNFNASRGGCYMFPWSLTRFAFLDCFLLKKFLCSIKFCIKVVVSLHMNTPLRWVKHCEVNCVMQWAAMASSWPKPWLLKPKIMQHDNHNILVNLFSLPTVKG